MLAYSRVSSWCLVGLATWILACSSGGKSEDSPSKGGEENAAGRSNAGASGAEAGLSEAGTTADDEEWGGSGGEGDTAESGGHTDKGGSGLGGKANSGRGGGSAKGGAGGKAQGGSQSEEEAGTAGEAAATPIPETTGNETVDRLGASIAQCGYQSPSTVPAGWDMTIAGESCTFSFPSGWTVDGAGTQMTFASAPDSPWGTVVGSGVPMGVDPPTDCSPRGVAAWYLPLFEALGCDNPEIAYVQDTALVVVDTSYPAAHSVFTCDYQGTAMVGYIFTMGIPDIFCNIVVQSFWEPVEETEAMTCTLTQVLSSYNCPTGGGESCVDADCAAACESGGYAGGKCPTGGSDACECY